MKLALAVLVLLASWCAAAESLPPEIQKAFKVFQIKSVGFDAGVIRVVSAKSIVNSDMFSAIAVNVVCAASWAKPGWGKSKIERVEVLNDIEGQGFAMVNAPVTCASIGKASGDQPKAILAANTVSCIVGVCRAR